MTPDQTTSQEIILKGVAAASGIAIGPAYVYSKQIPPVELKPITENEVDPEIERLHTANQRSEKELQKILTFAEHKLGAQNAKIFEAQIMILNDTILMGAIEKRIRQELKNAEYIVADEINKYKRLMLAAQDEYMHERAHDVEDVMNRIIRNIQNQKLFSRLDGESIIVSETLTPADTVIFSRNQILAYATDLGGVSSHAAILSRSLKIPAVVGLRQATRQVKTGDIIAVDGYSGIVAIRPTEETQDALRRKARRFQEFEEGLTAIAALSAETIDHKNIELSANIDFPEEMDFCRTQGAAGIGLYRTEAQLIGRSHYPTEDLLYEEYSTVAASAYPHPVIFRAFDLGGDKLVPGATAEENPFLGWRGIRVLLDRPDMFLTQLRAILRASERKNVRVMLPMVTSLRELHQAKRYLAIAMEELKQRGAVYDPSIKIGVMIEVPAAAILAKEFAAEADFLSIGTNDLVQYLLAVDRDNSSVAPLYEPYNPAVIRTIKMVIDAGHKHNTWVGMCGEMAGDPLATMLLVGLGIDELSVVPSVLPEIKKIILSTKLKEAKRIAEKVLTMTATEEIKEYLRSVVKQKLPDIPIEE
jgi:phosphotransferase system enzyme I (PtsI)